MSNYSDPTQEMLQNPIWNAIWEEIKSWDVNVPDEYGGYCGATGNHATAIFKAIEPKITGNEQDWRRLNRVFKSTSDKTIDQNMEIERLRIVAEDLSMIVRMMITKHRRGKLDEEYCLKAADYLQRTGLQGSIIRAQDTSAAPHAAPRKEQPCSSHSS